MRTARLISVFFLALLMSTTAITEDEEIRLPAKPKVSASEEFEQTMQFFDMFSKANPLFLQATLEVVISKLDEISKRIHVETALDEELLEKVDESRAMMILSRHVIRATKYFADNDLNTGMLELRLACAQQEKIPHRVHSDFRAMCRKTESRHA